MDLDRLTHREKDVYEAIVDGTTGNKAIGQRLAISPRTVETHKARVLAKLGADNTVGLLVKVIKEAKTP